MLLKGIYYAGTNSYNSFKSAKHRLYTCNFLLKLDFLWLTFAINRSCSIAFSLFPFCANHRGDSGKKLQQKFSGCVARKNSEEREYIPDNNITTD